MQALLRLRAPQLSSTLLCPRSTFRCRFGHDNFLALRRKTNFSYGSLRAIVRSQTPSSAPAPPPSHEPSSHRKTLTSVAGAAVVTIALASAIGCICMSLSRRERIGLAAPWHNIPVTSGAEQDRPEPKRDIASKELQNQSAMRRQIAADEVLFEMFERKDLPEKFYKISPNYPKIKEYFEDHLRLSDESWETLIKKWKEIKPGPDQIEIGLLLIDICIIKGDVGVATDIDKQIIKIAPELDHRPKIRRDIVNMIKDWDKKKERERKNEWKKFAKKMQDIVSSLSIDEPETEP